MLSLQSNCQANRLTGGAENGAAHPGDPARRLRHDLAGPKKRHGGGVRRVRAADPGRDARAVVCVVPDACKDAGGDEEVGGHACVDAAARADENGAARQRVVGRAVLLRVGHARLHEDPGADGGVEAAARGEEEGVGVGDGHARHDEDAAAHGEIPEAREAERRSHEPKVKARHDEDAPAAPEGLSGAVGAH